MHRATETDFKRVFFAYIIITYIFECHLSWEIYTTSAKSFVHSSATSTVTRSRMWILFNTFYSMNLQTTTGDGRLGSDH